MMLVRAMTGRNGDRPRQPAPASRPRPPPSV
jgi:hypothetical protein